MLAVLASHQTGEGGCGSPLNLHHFGQEYIWEYAACDWQSRASCEPEPLICGVCTDSREQRNQTVGHSVSVQKAGELVGMGGKNPYTVSVRNAVKTAARQL